MNNNFLDFYVPELNRLLELYDRFPTEQWPNRVDAIRPALRWIRCSLCLNARYRTYPLHLRTRICTECRQTVFRALAHRWVIHVHRQLHQGNLERVHEELLEYCFHPDRVLGTGCIETYAAFQNSVAVNSVNQIVKSSV